VVEGLGYGFLYIKEKMAQENRRTSLQAQPSAERLPAVSKVQVLE
jgi:hypothetical protein